MMLLSMTGIVMLFVLGTNSAYAIPIVKMDSPFPYWYFNGHGMQVIIDDSLNTVDTSDNTVNTKTVLITSTSDSTGCTVSLTETGPNTGLYATTTYMMSSSSHNCNVPQITTNNGDTVTVTDTTSGDGNVFTTATIKNSCWSDKEGDGYCSVTDSQIVPPSPQPYKSVQLSCPVGDVLGADGLCDSWKVSSTNFNGLSIPYTNASSNNGMSGTAYTITYNYPCDPNKTNDCPLNDGNKDVYVEIDYLKRHMPDATAIQDVINSYWNNGHVRLHVLVDEELPFHNNVISPPASGGAGGTDFDLVKNGYFGTITERTTVPSDCPTGITNTNFCISSLLTAKRQAFHYALFTHKQSATSTSSGYSEIPGNDMDISLGGFAGSVGNTMQQEGTFMHELGHNLGLNHGGPVWIGGVMTNDNSWNCKPNYPSVMNYAYQFTNYVNGRPLDYSHGNYASLSPTAPSDPAGLTANQGMTIVWAKSLGVVHTATTGGSIDWDWDSGTTDSASGLALVELGGTSGCPTSNPPSSLLDHNDWTNLAFGFQTSSSFGDGASAYYSVNTDGKFVANDNTVSTDPNDLHKSKFKHNNSKYNDEGDGMTREMVLAGLSNRVETLENDIEQLKDISFENKTSVYPTVTKTTSYGASNEGYVTTIDYSQGQQIYQPTPKEQLEKDLGDLDKSILLGEEYGATIKTQQIVEETTGSPGGPSPLISNHQDSAMVLSTLGDIRASIIQDSQANNVPTKSILEIVEAIPYWMWILVAAVIGLIVVVGIIAYKYRKLIKLHTQS